jgi:hypothetical protein
VAPILPAPITTTSFMRPPAVRAKATPRNKSQPCLKRTMIRPVTAGCRQTRISSGTTSSSGPTRPTHQNSNICLPKALGGRRSHERPRAAPAGATAAPHRHPVGASRRHSRERACPQSCAATRVAGHRLARDGCRRSPQSRRPGATQSGAACGRLLPMDASFRFADMHPPGGFCTKLVARCGLRGAAFMDAAPPWWDRLFHQLGSSRRPLGEHFRPWRVFIPRL